MTQIKAVRPCSFPGCGKRVWQAELCNGHYDQRRRGRVLTPIVRYSSTEDRFFAKVTQDGECWRWTGATSPLEYGAFNLGGKRGRIVRAHRWAYEYLRGEIPPELVLDHLCRNPWCVNPWHLEPVTHAVNKARGVNAEAIRSKALERTHCKQGHELPAPTISPSGHVKRVCRICVNDYRRRWRRAAKERAS